MENLLSEDLPTNYVYDDDNSIKFPSWESFKSKSETACASKLSETKEETATPKIIRSLKQDHWILDKKNKQLTRVHGYPTIPRNRSYAEKAYMEYIKKIYSFCCHLNENQKGFGNDVIPVVFRHKQIDMDRTIHNAQPIDLHYPCEELPGKQTRHFLDDDVSEFWEIPL